MSLSSSQYTPLHAAVQAGAVSSTQTFALNLAAFAAALELHTRRSVRRRFTTRQRVLTEARSLAGQADTAAWLIQYQITEIAQLRDKITRLEEDADLREWNEQAKILKQFQEFEDGRVFLETCALEHSFRDLLF